MQVSPAQSPLPSAPCAAPRPGPRPVLAVRSLGHRVPRADFTAHVHGVFARACHLHCGFGLLGVCAESLPEGPTTLHLAPGAADLRSLLRPGDAVARRGDWLHAPRLSLYLGAATTWRPRPRRALLDAPVRALRIARARVHPGARASALHSVPAMATLAAATRARDGDAALRAADGLVGRGEGLTPAGDDALVGWLAGLHVLRGAGDAWLGALAAGVAARSARTTPLAAHFLHLAAAGDFTAPLDAARDALLCDPLDAALAPALDALLACGASSGADALCGLLAAAEGAT